MLEELMEFQPATIVISLIAWGVCMLVLWKGVSGWLLRDQILISIVSLPIIYLAVNYQMNK